MSNHHHLSRRRAERTLDASTGSDPVVGPVLDALRAPARVGELRREDAAVTAFHSARLTPTPTRSDMSTSRSAAARAAIATGVVVALSTGGFALAATNHLPTLPDQASDQATESVAKNRAASTVTPTVDPTTTATSTPTAAATKTKKPKKSKTPKPVDPSATTAPSPNLAGLCNAFQAHDKSLHGKSLASSAFTALATAAGGKDNIATYCVALIGEPTVKPTKEAKPTKAPKTHEPKPTKAPQTHKPKPTKAPKAEHESKGKSATAGKH